MLCFFFSHQVKCRFKMEVKMRYRETKINLHIQKRSPQSNWNKSNSYHLLLSGTYRGVSKSLLKLRQLDFIRNQRLPSKCLFSSGLTCLPEKSTTYRREVIWTHAHLIPHSIVFSLQHLPLRSFCPLLKCNCLRQTLSGQLTEIPLTCFNSFTCLSLPSSRVCLFVCFSTISSKERKLFEGRTVF